MRGRLAIFLSVVVLLALLAALNAFSYVKVEDEAEMELRPDRSTLNAGPTGTRALYDFLQQSGYRVARWTEGPAALLGDRLPEEPATFVVVGAARVSFREEEARALLRWVRRGGRLVVIDRAPDDALVGAPHGWSVTVEPSSFPDAETRPEDAASMTAGAVAVAPAQPTLLTRDVEQVQPSRFASLIFTRPASDAGPAPSGADDEDETDGLDDTVPDEAWRAEEKQQEEEAEPPPPPPARTAPPVVRVGPTNAGAAETARRAPAVHVPDGRGGGGALLVDYEYGRGRVVLLADPYVVANGGIARADNLQLAANVVAGAGGLVVFDEYHQGRGAGRGGGGAFALLRGTPVLWMFAQGGVIVLAMLWSWGLRYGRPLPAPHVDRRSKLEFVASMAELQERARAYGLAVENVYARTRRALARYAGLQPTAGVEEIAARVAARTGRDRRQTETLLAECERAAAGDGETSARRALALVRRLRALERDLGIRMRQREIRQKEKVKR